MGVPFMGFPLYKCVVGGVKGDCRNDFTSVLGKPVTPVQPKDDLGSAPLPPPPPGPASVPGPSSKPGPEPVADQVTAPGRPQIPQPIKPGTKKMLDDYIEGKEKQKEADKWEKLERRAARK